MTERYDLRDEHGRISGYVLREAPRDTVTFQSGFRAPESESPFAVALCFAIGAVMLVASLTCL
jgi:hypothetical protein